MKYMIIIFSTLFSISAFSAQVDLDIFKALKNMYASTTTDFTNKTNTIEIRDLCCDLNVGSEQLDCLAKDAKNNSNISAYQADASDLMDLLENKGFQSSQGVLAITKLTCHQSMVAPNSVAQTHCNVVRNTKTAASCEDVIGVSAEEDDSAEGDSVN